MRVLLWMWFAPMAFFWTWFVLASADVGYVFFTREVYDQTFGIYAAALGLDPAVLPPLVLKACIVDSALVLGIFAFVRRKRILAWWRSRQPAASAQPAATSLSSAP